MKKHFIIFILLYSNICFSQTNLLTELQKMCLWNYSTVKLDLEAKKITFNEVVFDDNKSLIIYGESFTIHFAYPFDNKANNQIMIYFEDNSNGKQIRNDYYKWINENFERHPIGNLWIMKIKGQPIWTVYTPTGDYTISREIK